MVRKSIWRNRICHEPITPALDSRLRRLAKKRGLVLRKSRGRLHSIDNLGGYRIIYPHTNLWVLGEQFDVEPSLVEAFLRLPSEILKAEISDAMVSRQIEAGEFDHLFKDPAMKLRKYPRNKDSSAKNSS